MSRATYTDGKNPTDNFTVEPNPSGEGYIIGVKRYCECGSECCSRPQIGVEPHSGGHVFTEEDDAHEWIEATSEAWERDYDDYLEENRYELVQMERYEMWRREY